MVYERRQALQDYDVVNKVDKVDHYVERVDKERKTAALFKDCDDEGRSSGRTSVGTRD